MIIYNLLSSFWPLCQFIVPASSFFHPPLILLSYFQIQIPLRDETMNSLTGKEAVRFSSCLNNCYQPQLRSWTKLFHFLLLTWVLPRCVPDLLQVRDPPSSWEQGNRLLVCKLHTHLLFHFKSWRYITRSLDLATPSHSQVSTPALRPNTTMPSRTPCFGITAYTALHQELLFELIWVPKEGWTFHTTTELFKLENTLRTIKSNH